MRNVHYHADERGFLHRCYHQTRHWLSPGFLAGWIVASTITFPLEHIQWDHVWPFYYVGDWLNRIGHFQMIISYVWVLMFLASLVLGFIYAVRSSTMVPASQEAAPENPTEDVPEGISELRVHTSS